jgi:hypothetical protein
MTATWFSGSERSPHGRAQCVRCGATVTKHKRNSLDRTLAWSMDGVVLFVIANTYPFLGFKVGAQIRRPRWQQGSRRCIVNRMPYKVPLVPRVMQSIRHEKAVL